MEKGLICKQYTSVLMKYEWYTNDYERIRLNTITNDYDWLRMITICIRMNVDKSTNKKCTKFLHEIQMKYERNTKDIRTKYEWNMNEMQMYTNKSTNEKCTKFCTKYKWNTKEIRRTYEWNTIEIRTKCERIQKK